MKIIPESLDKSTKYYNKLPENVEAPVTPAARTSPDCICALVRMQLHLTHLDSAVLRHREELVTVT